MEPARQFTTDPTAEIWTAADDRRLRALVLAMLPYAKILSEFPHHGPGIVRDALARHFLSEPAPVEIALRILGDRAAENRCCPTGFVLDGRPCGAAQLVEAANDVLKARLVTPISYVGSVHP